MPHHSRDCAPPRHGTPALSLQGTKQSIGGGTTTWIATARHVASSSWLKAAPRNDERGGHCGPASSLHPAPSLRGTKQSIGGGATTWIATARHVASSSRLKAAPRNDERGGHCAPGSVTAPPARHCTPPRHCEERSNPLRPWQRHMDWHGAARLAMTEGMVTAPPPRHCEERSNPSGLNAKT
jgi:hypothetical protein